MIKDQAAFERALETAAALFSDPDYRGPPLDARLSELLTEIAMFERSAAPTSGEAFSRLCSRAQALVRKAAHLNEPDPFSSFPRDGHGIGPTTGWQSRL